MPSCIGQSFFSVKQALQALPAKAGPPMDGSKKDSPKGLPFIDSLI